MQRIVQCTEALHSAVLGAGQGIERVILHLLLLLLHLHLPADMSYYFDCLEGLGKGSKYKKKV